MNWELITALGGVGALLAAGTIYGRLVTRLETVEREQKSGAKQSEVLLMFEEIRRRLSRIEHHFDNPRSDQ
jgi:hypothetical protein